MLKTFKIKMKKILFICLILLGSIAGQAQCRHGNCNSYNPYYSKNQTLIFAGTTTVSIGAFATLLGVYCLHNQHIDPAYRKAGIGLCIAGGSLMTVSVPLFACTKRRKPVRWCL
jgi:hypothetical protein